MLQKWGISLCMCVCVFSVAFQLHNKSKKGLTQNEVSVITNTPTTPHGREGADTDCVTRLDIDSFLHVILNKSLKNSE